MIAAYGLLLVACLHLSMAYQRPNNGDGWRTLRWAHIEAPEDYYAKRPFPRYYQFRALQDVRPVDLVPISSPALVVEVFSFVQRLLGAPRFDFFWVTAFYHFLFLLGILLIALSLPLPAGMVFTAAMLNPFVLAFFNSPYEESLILALSPLLAYLLIAQHGRTATIRTLALAIASSKAQFIPVILLGLNRARWRNNLVYLAISAILVGLVLAKVERFKLDVPNGYNRFFNGLAYSMAGVSGWPARDFVSRQSIASRMTSAETVSLPAEATRFRQYWGSSYWPSGIGMHADEAEQVAANVNRWYRETLVSNAGRSAQLVLQPFLTMLGADYRMNYIFSTEIDNLWMRMNGFLMQHFGMIFLLAVLCALCIALKARNVRQIGFLLFCLLYPTLVVYGDGYYEFEKHVFPVMYLSVTFSLYLSAATLSTIFGARVRQGAAVSRQAL